MNRKVSRAINGGSRRSYPVIALRALWFFFFFSLYSFSFSQNNFLNPQFDINDPRNPDCPCHKLQKQAEDEFAQLNKMKDVDQNMNKFDRDNEKVQNETNRSNEYQFNNNTKGISVSGVSVKHRNKNVFIRKRKHHYSNRAQKLWHSHPNYSNCFRWSN